MDDAVVERRAKGTPRLPAREHLPLRRRAWLASEGNPLVPHPERGEQHRVQQAVAVSGGVERVEPPRRERKVGGVGAECVAQQPRPPRHRGVDSLLRVLVLEEHPTHGDPSIEGQVDGLRGEGEGLPMRPLQPGQAGMRPLRDHRQVSRHMLAELFREVGR